MDADGKVDVTNPEPIDPLQQAALRRIAHAARSEAERRDPPGTWKDNLWQWALWGLLAAVIVGAFVACSALTQNGNKDSNCETYARQNSGGVFGDQQKWQQLYDSCMSGP
jgi:hypothetical protein